MDMSDPKFLAVLQDLWVLWCIRTVGDRIIQRLLSIGKFIIQYFIR